MVDYCEVRAASALSVECKAVYKLWRQDLIVSAAEIARSLHCCGGNLLVTGAGKSGFVAQKFVSTLRSMGCRAFYMDPLGMLHGDLGCVRLDDLVIAISKSGETDELVLLAQKVSVIAMTSNASSRLAKVAVKTVHVPLEIEADVFNVIPTASTTVYMVVCDMICVAFAEASGLTLEKFLAGHPAGAIGQLEALR